MQNQVSSVSSFSKVQLYTIQVQSKSLKEINIFEFGNFQQLRKELEKIQLLFNTEQLEECKQQIESLIRENGHVISSQLEDTQSKQILKDFLSKLYMQILIEREDLKEAEGIARNSMDFETKLRVFKQMNSFEDKQSLLFQQLESKSKHQGVIDITTHLIESKDLFANVEEIKFSKQKDLLLLFCLDRFNQLDLRKSYHSLGQAVQMFKIANEFQQGYDQLTKGMFGD